YLKNSAWLPFSKPGAACHENFPRHFGEPHPIILAGKKYSGCDRQNVHARRKPFFPSAVHLYLPFLSTSQDSDFLYPPGFFVVVLSVAPATFPVVADHPHPSSGLSGNYLRLR